MGIEEYAPVGWDGVADLYELATWEPAGADADNVNVLVETHDDGFWSLTWTDGEPLPRFHRRAGEGPAVVYYDPEDDLLLLEWFDRAFLHREDGPALVEHSRSLGTFVEEWWTDGSCVKRRFDGVWE